MTDDESSEKAEGDAYKTGDVRGTGIAIGPGARATVSIQWERPTLDLAAAEARLAEMPLNEVPEVGDLPSNSRMELGRNELFTGREADLKALARMLKGEGHTAAIGQTAVTGLGGIGKTQLAVEFVYRYGRYFAGGVHWLSFADPDSIPAEVVQCGMRMELRPNFGKLPQEEQVALVRGAWQGAAPRLLIFDNNDGRVAEKTLAKWRPMGGGARVLMTSRRENWDDALGVDAMQLELLGRAESVALLRKFRPGLEESAADEIAAELGDLPLGLHLAGSYLRLYGSVLATQSYLDEWRQEKVTHESMAGEWISFEPTDRELNLFNNFMLSWRRLQPEDEVDRLALALAARAARFAPGEAIPWHLLRATLEDGGENGKQRLLLRRALRRLLGLGLVSAAAAGSEEEQRGVVMHRLVAAFAAAVSEDAEALGAVEKTLAAEAQRINGAGFPGPMLRWQGHLRYVADSAVERGSGEAAVLVSMLGYHLMMIGDYTGARPYLSRAVAIRLEVLGPRHPDTAVSLNNLAELLHWMGEYESARSHYEQALAIREETLGPEHLDTAESLNDLGELLRAKGEYGEARVYLERSLAILERVLGPVHPHMASVQNNLGLLLQAMKEYGTARHYFERALAIWQEIFGPRHQETARGLNNMGLLLQAKGEYEKAWPYYEQALAIWQEVLGPEHPHTAIGLSKLGSLMERKGERTEARQYYERALAIFEKALGSEHPHTKSVRGNLKALDEAKK